MKKLKWQIWLILIVDLLLIVVGSLNTVNVYNRAGLPFPTKSDSNKIYVESDIIIDSIKLSSGDVLLSIDGIEVGSHAEIEYLLDFHDLNDIVEIRIESKNIYKTLKVNLTSYYEDYEVIIFIITSLLMFFVALTCLLSKPDQKSTIIFHHAAFAAGMMVLMTWGRIGHFPLWIDIISRILYDGCFIFTPILFFHFSLYFPKRLISQSYQIYKICLPSWIDRTDLVEYLYY